VSALILLAEAKAAGLMLRAGDGRVHWRADTPPAPDLLARLGQQKGALLEILVDVEERAGILEFDGGAPREQAEAQALAEVLAHLGAAR
jgi:D-serine deaminase-like pyridoxal phosphate-dependent protein